MKEFGKPEKGQQMPKERNIPASDSEAEHELIGDQTHDHLWWGKTGRPTERNGILAYDADARSESPTDEAPGKFTGGHDGDWQEK